MRYKIVVAALCALPVVLFAFSTGPPVRRTGASVDGGTNCTACHVTFAPANSDPRGSVSIDPGVLYTPGVAQTIRVSVKHPDAARWGFQLTARLASDLTKQAGTFSTNAVVQVRCDPTGNAPCNGALEFAEHVSAPRTNPGDGFSFEVQWTPPATDMGDIVFYAAGNAANGNGSPLGDRIYTTEKTVSTCRYTAKPALTAVVNSASYQAAWAPNSLLTIFGSGFYAPGRVRLPASGDMAARAFPKNFACLAVEIAGERVPILAVASNQINVQAPSTALNGGPVNVTVILNPGQAGELSSDVMVNNSLQRFAPAFFTFNGKSTAALFAGTRNAVADSSVVPSGRAAKPGEVVSLFGTGFGYTDPVWQAGELPTAPARLGVPYAVTIGGSTLSSSDVLYAGLAQGAISGVYQLDVRIPPSAPDGDVPVSVTVNGIASPGGTTIPVRR